MGLEEQIDYLLQEHQELFQEDVELEKEVRIPLKELPPEVLDKATKYVIRQAFICVGENGTDVRIRESKSKNLIEYSLTAKHRPKYHEAEMLINKDIFNSLWPVTTKQQVKTRYKWHGWDIDVFEDGGIVAEFEYTRKSDIKIPTHWRLKDAK